MEYSFDKIIIYYKNSKVHHAKIVYKKNYGPGRIVEHEKVVYSDELDNELKKIIHYYRKSGNINFDINKLIEYRDYEKISKNKLNNQMLSHIDSIENTNYDMMEKIRKKLDNKNIKIKKISAISLSLLLAISGVGYSVSHSKPKENTMEKYYKSVMYINDNYEMALSDIDNVLNLIDSINESDITELYDKINMCKSIINSNKSLNSFYRIIIDKFLNLGGLTNMNILSPNQLKHLCMYGANLIMGGDNYGNLYANSDLIAMNLNTTKDKDYYSYLANVVKKYNITSERAEYSAVYAESMAYEKLPTIIKYIIISQTENAIKKAHFDFSDKKIMPTWWVSLKDKYDYDKLVKEIVMKKEECRNEIYANNSFLDTNDNVKTGHLK